VVKVLKVLKFQQRVVDLAFWGAKNFFLGLTADGRLGGCWNITIENKIADCNRIPCSLQLMAGS
jgi:hypothetical protein